MLTSNFNKKTKRTLLLLGITLFLPFTLVAQTGPGGIGNSSNNGLWLRADALSQANGSVVNSWTDKSDNNNHAQQTSSALQPTFQDSSALNGMPVIVFDGAGDEMIVADDDLLDGSEGLTYFAVIRPKNLNGSTPRGILGKRQTYNVSVGYAYTWFFWGGDRLNVDINTANNRFNSSNTFTNNTNYLVSFGFDGSKSANERATMYTGGTLTNTATEASTSIINSPIGVTLGGLNSNYGSTLGADYAEIIQYNYALNSLEYLTVNNYLSAKYDIPISNPDVYKGDLSANGDYDFNVAGIGRLDTMENNSARGSSDITIFNPSNLDNNEFLFWGNNKDSINLDSSGSTPNGFSSLIGRKWYISELDTNGNSIDVGSVDIQIDLEGITSADTANIRLFIDTDFDGLYDDETPVGNVSRIGGIYTFSGVTQLTNGTTFTFGIRDTALAHLPVELSEFLAIQINESTAEIKWTTTSEVNNDYFEIQKLNLNNLWNTIDVVAGAGNSQSIINYNIKDFNLLKGNNYYRLKQTDYDGKTSISKTIALKNKVEPTQQLKLFPNPANSSVTLTLAQEIDIREITVTNVTGSTVNHLVEIFTNADSYTLDIRQLKAGIYWVTTGTQTTKLVKQ